MAKAEKQRGSGKGKRSTKRSKKAGRDAITGRFMAVSAAARAGLLQDDTTQNLRFRAPARLIKAAKRESGLTSPTELGIVALSMLAEPDPVLDFLKRTKGALGEDAELDY